MPPFGSLFKSAKGGPTICGCPFVSLSFKKTTQTDFQGIPLDQSYFGQVLGQEVAPWFRKVCLESSYSIIRPCHYEHVNGFGVFFVSQTLGLLPFGNIGLYRWDTPKVMFGFANPNVNDARVTNPDLANSLTWVTPGQVT